MTTSHPIDPPIRAHKLKITMMIFDSNKNRKSRYRYLIDKPGICVACQVKPGNPMYGILICPECDEEIFVKPYGHRTESTKIVASIALTFSKKHPKFDELEAIYRFDKWDTLISGRKGFKSMPVIILQGIQPMTQEYLNKLVDKLDLYLTFS